MKYYKLYAIILAVILTLLCKTCYSQVVDIAKIIQIESSGNPDAYNPISKAIGLCQITSVCLLEWNNYHPNGQYDELDLYNGEINTLIGNWYVNIRIPSMLKYYRIPDTINNRIIAYNFGIGHLRNWYRAGADYELLPKETKNYIVKYNRGLND